MPTPPDSVTQPIKSPSENARWRKAHINRDRALLQATLPLPLVRACDQEAESLGLSRAAYLAGVLSLADDFRYQIVMRIRLHERQNGMKFRSPASPVSDMQGTPAHASKVSP